MLLNRLTALAFIAALFAFPVVTDAQSQFKYKRQLKKAERVQERQQNSGIPITLDPIEQVPSLKTKRFEANAARNWGLAALCPDSIYQRIYNECTYPVTIKVFDTGGKLNHPWIPEIPGSVYTGETDPLDGNGHATHCSGIIAGNNGVDRVGFAAPLFQKGLAQLKPVKVLRNDGGGDFGMVDNAIKGEDTDNKRIIQAGGYVVVSMSLGANITNTIPSTEAALKASTEAGVRYVIAAGNSGGAVGYPGRSPYSITCAALAENFSVASYSSRGPEVDFAMPGSNIYSTYKSGQFATLSGTSMATPALAASTAIMFSKWGPKAPKTIAEIERYLAWCATDVPPAGKDGPSGWGYLFTKAILDKDPTKIPAGFPGGGGGGPTDPPPPPPNDPGTPPTREIRTLNLDYVGSLPIVWSISGSSQALENIEVGKWSMFKDPLGGIFPYCFTPKNKAQAQNVLTVVEVEYELTTNYYAPDAFNKLKEGTEAFFKNRGLLLQNPSDYADAAYWSGFFLDMYLDREKKLSVVMKSIIAKDEKGNTIKITKFRNWPLN